ncbi:MAG TPA: hypothetical protein VF942_06780 [Acidimicrobiales bacterium]
MQFNNELVKADVKFVSHHPTYIPKVMFWNGVRLFDLRGTRDALFTAQFLPYSRSLVTLSVRASYVLELLAIVGIPLSGVDRALHRGPCQRDPRDGG